MVFMLSSRTKVRWRAELLGPGRLSDPEIIVAAALEVLRENRR